MQRMLRVYVVRDNIVPGQVIGRTCPAPRQATELLRRKNLQCAHQRREQHGDRSQLRDSPIGPATLEDVIKPRSAGGESQEDGHLMMTAQPRHANTHAAQRGAGPSVDTSCSSQQKQENQRGPHSTVHHLRPIGPADISSESEGQTRDQRSGSGPSQIAAQEVAEQRGHVVHHNVVPLDGPHLDVIVPPRHQP